MNIIENLYDGIKSYFKETSLKMRSSRSVDIKFSDELIIHASVLPTENPKFTNFVLTAKIKTESHLDLISGSYFVTISNVDKRSCFWIVEPQSTNTNRQLVLKNSVLLEQGASKGELNSVLFAIQTLRNEASKDLSVAKNFLESTIEQRNKYFDMNRAEELKLLNQGNHLAYAGNLNKEFNNYIKALEGLPEAIVKRDADNISCIEVSFKFMGEPVKITQHPNGTISARKIVYNFPKTPDENFLILVNYANSNIQHGFFEMRIHEKNLSHCSTFLMPADFDSERFISFAKMSADSLKLLIKYQEELEISKKS